MDAEEFLATTISILAAAPDFRAAIEKLSRLANACFSDWCGVFMIESGALRRLLPVEGLYPVNPYALAGPGHVVRTGEAQFLTDVTDDLLEDLGFRADESRSGSAERALTCLCLPLIVRGGTAGAIAFISGGCKADLAGRDFVLARAVAQAAAVALDNAESHRRAQEANRLKDDFVSMVSHELRTPLTPMLGGIHLLRTARLSQSSLDRALDIIERNAQAQLRIVEDLLDASRIVTGKLQVVMNSVELRPLLEAAVDSVRSSAVGKGVKLVTILEDVQQPIEADSHRIQQIMRHLLSNAVKFTPPEGQIEVSMKSHGDHVVIEVADTGIGIPAEFLPRIFDRFRAADNADAKLRSGLGIGLAISRHLVELHQGSIEAASPGHGRGAVFTLKFPIAARRAVAVGNSASDA